MNKFIFVKESYNNKLVEEIIGKYSNVGKLDLKSIIHYSVIKFFDIDDEEYYNILSNERRRTTPNTLFSVTEESAYNYFDEIDYKGDDISSGDGIVPLTLDEAFEFVANYCVKPILGHNIYSKRIVKDFKDFLSNHSSFNGMILCGYYSSYADTILPFIKEFGKSNVIVINESSDYDENNIYEYLDSIIAKVEF